MKRRAFLQRSSLALTAFGLSEVALSKLASRYYQVLAEPTPRKLAFLIGINQYRTSPLNGCVTDVELQQELLQHRFGFQAADILTLTDQQATRSAIATAFQTHLIEQAKPGDVVVFHFSGYGEQVSLESDTAQISLVTVVEPATEESPIVNNLLEETLLQWLRSLQTDKITTIFDTSYFYPGKPLQGNLRIRARPIPAAAKLNQAELKAPATQLGSTQVEATSDDRLIKQRSLEQFPGILLAAAGANQLATEARWNGFHAGLFTYALTQQLWQATAPTSLQTTLKRATEQVERLVVQEQHPQLSGQRSRERSRLPYDLLPPGAGADGVVIGIEENGRIARLWLGGLSPLVLEQYGSNALLTIVEPADSMLRLQLLSRDGLVAKARLQPADGGDPAETALSLQVGQFVREFIRILPRNIGLTVALDSSLERIERVDAISAISTIPRVSSAIAGEQAADYLFSKTNTPVPTQIAALPTVNLSSLVASSSASTQSSYGLFSPGQDAIANTAGEGGEAVKVAVRRLVPKFQTLLAAKLLNLTVNESASRLAVAAMLEMVAPQTQVLLSRETAAAQQLSRRSLTESQTSTGLQTIAAGSRIQYRLENRSSQPFYALLLGLDNSGNLTFLSSPALQSFDQPPGIRAEPIAPTATLTLPQTAASFQWVLHGPTGLAETFVICSRAPFSQTLTLLEPVLRPTANAPSLNTLSNPLDVAQAVLQDLHQASLPAIDLVGAPADALALDMNVWASLRFVYQVV